jgi:Cohesin domain
MRPTLKTLALLGLLLLLGLSARSLSAARVTVGTVSGTAGSTVTVPISYAAEGASVTILSVDLLFSAPLSFNSVTTGAAATSAGKQATTSTITGGVKLLVYGVNQTTIGDGALANVVFNVAAGASGTLNITTANASAANAAGGSVSLATTNGAVTVAGGGGGSTFSALSGKVTFSVTYRNQYSGQSGNAVPIPQNGYFAFFYFTDPANPEVFVKALDFGSTYPVFFGGLTDFEVTVTVTVVRTGQTMTMHKNAGAYLWGADSTTMLP